MRNHKPGIILTLTILISCFLFVAPASAGGIGVSPSHIELTEALRGGEYSRILSVINPGEEETEYALSAEGEAAGWISFYAYAEGEATTPIERIAVPPGSRGRLYVKFSIPEDAGNRPYQATIVVVTAPPEIGEEQESAEGSLGGVVARPNISVEIRKGDELVKSLSSSDQAVKPDAKEVIRVEDETAGMSDGEYQAKIVVSLGGEVLTTKELSFKLLPVGTLSRDGKLVSLTTEGDAVADQVLKILATFANTGEIETPAQLVAEVYRDGALLGVEESRELLVLPKERTVLKAYLKLQEPGDYTIKGQVNYGGKLTDVSELSLKLTTASQAQAAPTAPVKGQQPSSGGSAEPTQSQSLLFGLERQTAIIIAFLAAIALVAGFLIWSLVTVPRKRGASKVS